MKADTEFEKSPKGSNSYLTDNIHQNQHEIFTACPTACSCPKLFLLINGGGFGGFRAFGFVAGTRFLLLHNLLSLLLRVLQALWYLLHEDNVSCAGRRGIDPRRLGDGCVVNLYVER